MLRLPKTRAALADAARLHAGQARRVDGAPFIVDYGASLLLLEELLPESSLVIQLRTELEAITVRRAAGPAASQSNRPSRVPS